MVLILTLESLILQFTKVSKSLRKPLLILIAVKKKKKMGSAWRNQDRLQSLAAIRESSSSQVLPWNLLRESSTVEEGRRAGGSGGRHSGLGLEWPVNWIFEKL